MSKPMHADRWYETPNVDELRQEFQNAYQVIDSAIDGVNIANYYTKTETNNLLDAFYTSAEVDALVTPSAILTKLLTVDGPGSGLNADLLDGYDHTDFAKLTGATFTGTVQINGGSGYVPLEVRRTLSGTDYDAQIAIGSNGEAVIVHQASDVTSRVLRLDGSQFSIDNSEVADYGSNANGSYVRFYNGVQVCWHSGNVNYATIDYLSRTWTYPAAFVAAPTCHATPDTISVTPNITDLTLLRTAGLGSTSVQFVFYRQVGEPNLASGDAVLLYFAAIGRWF